MKTNRLCLLVFLAVTACGSPVSAIPSRPTQTTQESAIEVDLRGTAAAEATAILEAAAATAIIREAQATAAALLEPTQAGWLGEEPVITLSTADVLRQERLPTPQPYVVPTSENTPGPGESANSVQILKVELGGEGGFIVVNYTSTYQEAQQFWPGRVWVEDEETGVIYEEVAVMPVIGLLIARPQEDGQPGYVMFVNNPPLSPGASVTVVLNTFKIEHVPVQ